MHKQAIAGLAAAAATLILLAGCGQREDVPDTRTMGAAPAASGCAMRTEEVLQQVNAARAAARQCGRRHMPAAAPLRWDEALYSAASSHSVDMARRNYFDHRSPEGVNVSDRVSASRYKWRSVGENLSGGSRTASEAVQGWLESPEHCENLMDPKFVDVAVACVQQPGTEWGTYWTMVLGRK
jgi:uncharacterized protein YkwD